MAGVRVVLAEDAVFLREAIARLLREEGFEVAAEVGDPTALRQSVARTRPDLAVVDIRMPPSYRTEGLAAAVAIRRDYPQVGVLLLSQHLEPRYLSSLLGDDPRGVGYLLKERVSGVDEFVDAARQVAAGGCAVDREVVALLLAHRRQHDLLALLSAREQEVLGLMAEGRSNVGIGRRLHVSQKTVEAHVRNIFQRLELPVADDDHRRVMAVLRYLRPDHPGPP